MISITDFSKCCGCGACVQRCPHSCIKMQADDHGFEHPLIDQDRCVDCHLCEIVCPVIHHQDAKRPISVFSAKHKSESVRMRSSSGGIFSLLAQTVLERDGVVFGARFDSQWNVIHDSIDSIDNLHYIMGSKYVQSQIGTCFKEAECFLKAGRFVMFTGTPCQIAGLNNFLGKSYENLLNVDIVCHGVPSPKLWKDYISSLGIKDIQSVNFRSKESGWKSYSIKVEGKNDTYLSYYGKDRYFEAFLKDLSLRTSCYSCFAKAGSSGSDITLGDFWGIAKYDPEIDDDIGISLVFVNSPKGESFINDIKDKAVFKLMNYEVAVEGNPSAIRSSAYKTEVDDFWQSYQRDGIEGMYKMLKKMRRSKLSLGVIIDVLKWKIINLIKR